MIPNENSLSLIKSICFIFPFSFHLSKQQQPKAKTYKRHSSVIPSTHLMDEVKEVKIRSDKDFTAGQYWFTWLKTHKVTYRHITKASTSLTLRLYMQLAIQWTSTGTSRQAFLKCGTRPASAAATTSPEFSFGLRDLSWPLDLSACQPSGSSTSPRWTNVTWRTL